MRSRVGAGTQEASVGRQPGDARDEVVDCAIIALKVRQHLKLAVLLLGPPRLQVHQRRLRILRNVDEYDALLISHDLTWVNFMFFFDLLTPSSI